MKNKRLIGCLMAVSIFTGCSSDNDDNTDPEPPISTAEVLLEESFDQSEGELPEGWTISNGNEVNFKTEDGALIIDAMDDNYEPVSITAPLALSDYKNYRIDAEFTLTDKATLTRWGALQYHIENDDLYYQMAIRANAMASNGTELTKRSDGEWSVSQTQSFTEQLDPEKLYQIKIIVHDGQVEQYLNDQLMHKGEVSDVKGGIGFQAAGAVMKITHFKVTEQLEPLAGLGDIYMTDEPVSDIAMAPTLVQQMSSMDELSSSKASNAYFKLDQNLNLLDIDQNQVGTLAEFFAQETIHHIPVLDISDIQVVELLAELVNQYNYMDITVLGTSDIVLAARTEMPSIRGAVDFTDLSQALTEQEVNDIVAQTNKAKSKIAVLSESAATRETISALQKRLITVWVKQGKLSVVEVVTSGANGILMSDIEAYQALFAQFKPNSKLRKSYITGHRGVPSLLPENTIEGSQKALELGVDGNEYDIYLTQDNEIVVIHDADVKRTTDGEGLIEEMTLSEVKELRILDLDGNPTSMMVPTLKEYFETFKDQDMVHFVEIKSKNTLIVTYLKQLIDEYDVADQVIVISFDENQLDEMAKVLPEISVGLLTGAPATGAVDTNIRAILTATQENNSTFNSSYNGLTQELLEEAKHRGTTFWPWTYRDEDDFFNGYLLGIHGLTTDYIQWASDYIVQVDAISSMQNVVTGQALSTTLKATKQDRTHTELNTTEFIVIDSTAKFTNDTQLIFTSTGEATVLAAYYQALNEESGYYIYSTPIKVTIN